MAKQTDTTINPYACPRCGDYKHQTLVREDYLGRRPDGSHIFVANESESVMVSQIWDCPQHGSHSHVVTERSSESAIMPGGLAYVKANREHERDSAG